MMPGDRLHTEGPEGLRLGDFLVGSVFDLDVAIGAPVALQTGAGGPAPDLQIPGFRVDFTARDGDGSEVVAGGCAHEPAYGWRLEMILAKIGYLDCV